MSEILKAKNRIMNRSKIVTSQQETTPEHYEPEHSHHNFPLTLNEETFDLEPITSTYNKKFNISSISMKFMKQEEDEQYSNSYTPERYESSRLKIPEEEFVETIRKEKSPEFSRTEKINPIRHFEPHNLNTLSESNSHSNLYHKWAKSRSRRLISTTQSHDFEYDEKRSDVKTVIEKNEGQVITNESPIRKIRKTVHAGDCSILIAKEEKRRAQSPFKPRECAKEYTENKVKEFVENKKQFVDEEFPPKPTIVFPKKSLYQEEPNLSFQRLSNLYNVTDFEPILLQTCEPTLITPGQLTNPFVYSAMRILAEQPERILSLFENQKVNEEGIYYVRLCKDGTWRYVIVDNWVPVRLMDEGNSRSYEMLGMSSIESSNTVEIWPSLLEKALAKVYGTYYDLTLSRRDGICPIFRLLTGFPVSKYDLIKDVRSYLVLIDSALKRQHIIVLEEILPEFEYLAELKGLSIEESYQLIEIQKNNFVLRNLTDFDLVTRLTFDEVMMFSSLLIFRKEENYTYVSQKLRHKKGYFSLLKITVPTTTQCYWDIWQNNPAYYKNHLESKIEYEVSPYKITIQPLSLATTQTAYDSISEPETIVESGKQITMKKGEYLVNAHLCQNMQEMDFTLSYYGERDVGIERVKNVSQRWMERCCEDEEVGEGKEVRRK